MNDFNLRERIGKMPYNHIPEIRQMIIEKSKCSSATYDKVLNGTSSNMSVLVAIKHVFNCTLDDVINPSYQFLDPITQKAIQKVDAYFERIGAKQVR
jgi:hypothetical protein